MDKNEVITTLRDAARNHKKWVADARALIEGVPLEKDKVPVNPTECEFGNWYYTVGQTLNEIPGFKEIEESHNKLHKTYMEIFSILFGENEPSFFSKLLGRSRKKMLAEQREQAMNKYNILEEQSKTVISQLLQVEKVITAIGDKQFEKYSPRLKKVV
ncbi:MAG: CZB domain-containing protein [Candidatus Electrothrix sp. GW3-4]|uniref:CZB domain-containing protein n=1 Tax=Candidatus Electrothrix sp. GW3-4 TaxID=3126740 RepID=UPI0030CD4654